jgi:subtilase family serine protease
VWSEDGQAGGGGGVSVIFDRPWYQYAPGTTTDGGRLVPDLALLATSSPGIAIVDQAPGLIDGDGDGTSDASPMGAGMFALINDFIGGCRLGSPDAELYALGRWQHGDGGISVFHDTTIGNIAVIV